MTDVNQIHADLEQAAAARQEHAQAIRRLEASEPHLEHLETRVAQLRSKLDDEAADVERLESFSGTRIWSRVRGSHGTDLERETAEREAARYAVAEAEARLEAMRRDRAALEARLTELRSAERRYRDALAAKEAWVEQGSTGSAAILAGLAERRGELVALDSGAREAFEADREAHDLLSEAASLLAPPARGRHGTRSAGAGCSRT